jgi:hypothetical protein
MKSVISVNSPSPHREETVPRHHSAGAATLDILVRQPLQSLAGGRNSPSEQRSDRPFQPLQFTM